MPLPWPCPLKTVTGIPCPGCGTTRALAALARLDLGAALAWNPLAALAGLGAGAFIHYALVVVAARARRLRIVALSRVERLGAALAVLANWAYLVAAGR